MRFWPKKKKEFEQTFPVKGKKEATVKDLEFPTSGPKPSGKPTWLVYGAKWGGPKRLLFPSRTKAKQWLRNQRPRKFILMKTKDWIPQEKLA